MQEEDGFVWNDHNALLLSWSRLSHGPFLDNHRWASRARTGREAHNPKP